jgi:glutathione S-transferase
MIAGKVDNLLIKPNFETHFKFLNDQVKTSPGQYLCGEQLTGSDIMISYPLCEALKRGIITKESHPELAAYADRLTSRPAYKRAIEKDQGDDKETKL